MPLNIKRLSPAEIYMVKEVSRNIVKKVANEEIPIFDDVFQEYTKLHIEKYQYQRSQRLVEDEMYFTLPDFLQSLITPEVISAVIVGLWKVFELIEKKNITMENSGEKDTEDRVRIIQDFLTHNSISLDDLNLIGIQRELYRLLRSRGVGHKRADSISKEFIAIIVSDLNILIKIVNQHEQGLFS